MMVLVLASFAVYIMGYGLTYIYQEILLESLDIRDYVTNSYPPASHSPDWLLEVNDGVDLASTEWGHPTYLRVSRNNNSPGNGAVFATVCGNNFSTPGSWVGATLTFQLTYLGNPDPETNTFSWVYEIGPGLARRWLMGDDALIMPDSIILGDMPHTPVELSSFTATVTSHNSVQLDWVSQSEANLMGYRVYRNENLHQNDSQLVTPILIPATNTSETQSYRFMDAEVEQGHTYHYWLEIVEPNSNNFFGPVSATVTMDTPPVFPEVTSMKNSYPNPFKMGGSVNIEVDIKAGESGTLTIFNIGGQAVRSVSLSEGSHNVTWNGKDASGKDCGSGIYFYKLSTPSLNQTNKMVIIK